MIKYDENWYELGYTDGYSGAEKRGTQSWES